MIMIIVMMSIAMVKIFIELISQWIKKSEKSENEDGEKRKDRHDEMSKDEEEQINGWGVQNRWT